ncbi:MAG: FAD-dependent oxidoreductase [Planctomycetia bacterium]|nr:FAD-dependent oxidoreductase [Planctomycetia bacterium]
MPKGWTRREMLGVVLGAPLLAGCQGQPPAAKCEGEIVGPNYVLGHRVRDGAAVVPPADHWRRASVVIVGGGVAGLSAAWRLERAGFHDYVLLELEKAPGGTSRSGQSARVAFPWGAHYLPAPLKENGPLIELLDEMNVLEGRDADGQPVVAEQFLCRDPQERIFYRGRWYEGLYLHAGASAADLAELQAFNAEIAKWVAWRDGKGRRAFALPVSAGSDDVEVTELDQLSMAQWLDRKAFTSPRLRWLVDYACRDDYGLRAEQTSAWAGLFYFASRVAKPGGEARPLMTWPEGNGRLVRHLYEAVKDRVQLGTAVVELIPRREQDADRVDVVTLSADGAAWGWHAEQVIFAAPQFVAPHVIRPFRSERPKHVAAFEYGSWLVANLTRTSDVPDRGCPVAWDNVLYDSLGLGYVSATFQRGFDYGPAQWTYFFPFCDEHPKAARQKLLTLDWAACAELVLGDLQRAHPAIRTEVDRLDVMRWGHAMIRPRPGFIWGPERRAAQQPYRGIHFANTDLSGIALFEEAFYHGQRAAGEVLAAQGWKTILTPSSFAPHR